MSAQVIVLNGASSTGKTTLGRALQDRLPGHWLLLGVDTLIDALPARLRSPEGIEFGPGGEVGVGEAFRRLDSAWMAGVAAMVRAGARVIVDDVFLGGAASQARWQEALGDLPTLWVGVLCAPEVAEVRERERGDRVTGMHRQQAALVHRGVAYSLTVDTSEMDAQGCAEEIAAHLPNWG